jgi:hypothetical protein
MSAVPRSARAPSVADGVRLDTEGVKDDDADSEMEFVTLAAVALSTLGVILFFPIAIFWVFKVRLGTVYKLLCMQQEHKSFSF